MGKYGVLNMEDFTKLDRQQTKVADSPDIINSNFDLVKQGMDNVSQTFESVKGDIKSIDSSVRENAKAVAALNEYISNNNTATNQKITDLEENLKNEFAENLKSYLPLTGGTMTGAITLSEKGMFGVGEAAAENGADYMGKQRYVYLSDVHQLTKNNEATNDLADLEEALKEYCKHLLSEQFKELPNEMVKFQATVHMYRNWNVYGNIYTAKQDPAASGGDKDFPKYASLLLQGQDFAMIVSCTISNGVWAGMFEAPMGCVPTGLNQKGDVDHVFFSRGHNQFRLLGGKTCDDSITNQGDNQTILLGTNTSTILYAGEAGNEFARNQGLGKEVVSGSKTDGSLNHISQRLIECLLLCGDNGVEFFVNSANNITYKHNYRFSDGKIIINGVEVLSATGGGIVASSLGETGYVKFANGLILQWGKVALGGTTITDVKFPISFTKNTMRTYFSEQYTNYIQNSSAIKLNSPTLTQFTVIRHATTVLIEWFAIGV